MREWALICATGPSFQRSDAVAMRPHVSHTIAVNCAVFYVPWANIHYAADGKWWTEYGSRMKWYKGKRYSITGHEFGVERLRPTGWLRNGGNSGHHALQLCVDMGFEQIALLGYDHQHTGGEAHCHGDHPEGLGNAANTKGWQRQMALTAKDIEKRGVKVLNLTRETALDCFERMSVADFIGR